MGWLRESDSRGNLRVFDPGSLCEERMASTFPSRRSKHSFKAFSLRRFPLASATFMNPFPEPFPTPGLFPYFRPYSLTGNTSISTVSSNFRPALIQQFGLNTQVELARDWMLEVGYVGTLGRHLLGDRSPNQALLASPANPIRGVVSNTVANVGLRTPVPGVPPESLRLVESAGTSSFNDLEVSLNKRLSRGLQMLASYTFPKR
jgi:hypothetical protein